LIRGVDKSASESVDGSAAGVDFAAAVAPAPAVLLLLQEALRGVHRVVLVLAMVAVVCACIVLTESVVLRYFLHVPTDWQGEIAVFLLVFAIFGSAGWVQDSRGHIGIEAFDSLMSVRANRIRRWLCDLVSLLFCAFFAWKSWSLVAEAWTEGMTTSSDLAPPLWLPYGFMASGMTLLSLQLLLQVCIGPAHARTADSRMAHVGEIPLR
jgi:TRAP-type C4-dicarboxylate transport system permease small subunit